MQEFTVNEFLSLKLENSETNIYVNGERFRQCKYLLISIPLDRMHEWDHFETMDDIINATNNGRGEQRAQIEPEEAFKGHCSNMQAWAENGYDIKILDSRLSIPIIRQIMQDLLEKHNKEKAYVYPKDFWKDKFRRFFFSVVESLDDYIERCMENEYTFGKFQFLYPVLFRTKDIFFQSEEIEGSSALSKVYAHLLPRKQREIFIRKRNYWERKLYPREPVVEGIMYYVGDQEFYTRKDAEKYSKNKNLEHRRFLRAIRNATDEGSRFYITKSHRSDYLPYLYAKRQFTEERNISFLRVDDDLYIRDNEGHYWKEQ